MNRAQVFVAAICAVNAGCLCRLAFAIDDPWMPSVLLVCALLLVGLFLLACLPGTRFMRLAPVSVIPFSIGTGMLVWTALTRT